MISPQEIDFVVILAMIGGLLIGIMIGRAR